MDYFAIRLILILAFTFLQGCTMFSKYPADVKLVGVNAVKLNPLQQDFNLLVDITNTDKTAIFVRTIDYNLKVNGLVLADGNQFVWLSIPAKTTQQIKLKVSINLWNQLLPLLQTMKDKQQVNYYFSGKLVAGNLFFRRVTDIYHTDVLTVDKIPVKQVKKLQKLQKYQKMLKGLR